MVVPVATSAVDVVLGAGVVEVVVTETMVPAEAKSASRICSARGMYVRMLLRSDNR